MPVAKLIITVTVQGLTQSEAASKYHASKGWGSKLMARYRAEGDAASQEKSRRPHTSPNATPADVVALITRIRADLAGQGLDASIGQHP